jgi:hypothetical protein
MNEEMSVLNTLARRRAAPPAAAAPTGDGMIEPILEAQERARKYKALADGYLEALNQAKAAHATELAQARGECDQMRVERDAAARECAEYKGRCDVMSNAPKPEAHVDTFEAKYEAKCAELVDVQVQHASCPTKIQSKDQIIVMLNGQVADLTARLKTAEAPKPQEAESEADDATGCEIEVVRDGAEKIRSLKVRYTK